MRHGGIISLDLGRGCRGVDWDGWRSLLELDGMGRFYNTEGYSGSELGFPIDRCDQ